MGLMYLCRMLLQGGWHPDHRPLGVCILGMQEFACKPLWWGERAKAQPREKPRPSPNRIKRSPSHPQSRRAHLFKDEVAVKGAVIGASWEVLGGFL